MATTLRAKQRCPDKGHTFGDTERDKDTPLENIQKYKTTRSFSQGSLEDLTLLTQAQKRNLGKQLWNSWIENFNNFKKSNGK